MTNLRKILAMVLVLAMTFTMLPVFAAADDEAAAVQTVEAPAAEPAPAPAEAPAAEPAAAPVEPAAVEEVAEISAAPAEAAPVAEAIETVAAETVAPKAELQGSSTEFADDAAAVEAGYYWKKTVSGTTTYYDEAGLTAAVVSTGTVYQLCDYYWYNSASSSSLGQISLNDKCSGTLDLGGHTLTTKMRRPFLARVTGNEGYGSYTVRNGTWIHYGYGATTSGRAPVSAISFGQNSSYTTNVCTITLDHLNLFSLGYTTSYSTAAIASRYWFTNVVLNDSTVISEKTNAIAFCLDIDNASNFTSTKQTTVSGRGGFKANVTLNGNCTLGSLASAGAVSYNCKVTDETMLQYPHTLTVHANDPMQATYLGSAVAVKANASDTQENVCVIDGDFSSESTSITVPAASYSGTVSGKNLVPGTRSVDVTAWTHVHSLESVAEVPATAADTGVKAHYLCTGCGMKFQDALGETEATEEWLTIPTLSCAHEHVDHHEAAGPTYLATGNTEYWYCNDCEKYFTDSTCTTETTLEAVTIAKLNSSTDASVYTDAELVELGAVVKLTSPEGAVTAYAGVQDPATAAGAWTTSGGEYKLLRDYTVVATTASASPYVNWITSATTPVHDATLDVDVYGFWLDLGGHTLTITAPRPAIGRSLFTHVNVRNGRLVYRNTGRTAAVCGAINIGALGANPMSGSTILTPNVVISNAEIISLTATSTGYSQYAIDTTYWSNEIHLFNSKLISEYGYGVCFHKSSAEDKTGTASNSAKLTDAQIEILQTNGLQNNLTLVNSVVGTLNAGRSAVHYNPANAASNGYPFGYYEGIDHSVTITADTSSKLLGGGILYDNSTSKIDLQVTTPSLPAYDRAATTYSYALPDVTTIAAETASDAAPTNLAAADYSGFCYVPHVHSENVTYHEAVAATYAAPGNNAYYACTCGKYFADAECLTELDWDSDIVIPQLVCSHASKEHHDAVAPTFAAAGTIEYWSCPDCLKLFSDEACETEITEDDLAVAALTPADAAGKTDEQLVALGAVIKAVAPDTTVKAYPDIASGYNVTKTWTEAGGQLLLLTDVVIEDTTNSGNSGYMTIGNPAYANTEVAGMATKGVWFDLGGHTIDATLGKGLFYLSDHSGTLNLKNGTILFNANGRSAATMFGAIMLGYSSTSPIDGDAVKTADINFYQMNFYTKQTAGETACVVCGSMANTTVNVKDSTLLTSCQRPAIALYRSQSTATNDALEAAGANYTVNILGGTTIGSVHKDSETGKFDRDAVYFANYNNSTAYTENVAYTGTVTAADDTVFVGRYASSVADRLISDGVYTFTRPNADYVETTRNVGITQFGIAAEPCKAYVYPTVYVAEDLTALTTAPAEAKATLTAGGSTAYMAEIASALEQAEKIGKTSVTPTVTLNAPATATATYALGGQGIDSAFALDVNGQTLPAAGLFNPAAASGKTVTVTMAGAGTGKLFVGAPELTFAADDAYTVNKGSFFTNYSLNLEDSVTINLYTSTDPDAVYYVQDGTEYTIASKDAADAWVIGTLAAKQMSETVDAYAFKKVGTVTTIDYSKNISVKGYVDQDPATMVEAGDNHDAIVEALNATLDTMMIYGKLAEKFFDDDFTDLSAADLEAIGVDAVPETVTSNLEHADRTVTGMGDHTTDSTVGSGFWGSAAVLEDSISLKFYFYGAEFADASATVQIGEAAATAATLETNGEFKYVKASVSAKDFDTAITVAVAGVGSVTDSVEAYTARIGSGENHYKLAQALRAYGADAKRFYEAKNP